MLIQQFTVTCIQKIWRMASSLGPWQDAKIPAHSRTARCKWNATCALGDSSGRRRFPGDDPHIFHISTLTLWTFYFLHTSVIWFRTWEGDKPQTQDLDGFTHRKLGIWREIRDFVRVSPTKNQRLEGFLRFKYQTLGFPQDLASGDF